MANPQPDRFVKLSKEFMQALKRSRIPGVERQVLDTVMDHTWGEYPTQKWCQLTNKQFCIETGLTPVAVSKATKNLEEKRVLESKVVTKNGKRPIVMYRIQKDFERWNLLPKKVILPKMVTNVTKNGNNSEVTPIIVSRLDKKIKKSVFSEKIEKNAQIVIDRINQLSGKNFRNADPIAAVMRSKKIKATVEDCLKVVEYKFKNQFIRDNYFTPASLFRITKFQSALDEANNQVQTTVERKKEIQVPEGWNPGY